MRNRLEGKQIQRAADVPAAFLDGTLLMMSIEQGRYFSLNQVGTRIWELLEHPTTKPAVVERLVAEYEVAEDVCAREIEPFLEQLQDCGLLVATA